MGTLALNGLIRIFFSSKPRYLLSLISAFICPALLLHKFEMYLSKFNLLSISIPNSNPRKKIFCSPRLGTNIFQKILRVLPCWPNTETGRFWRPGQIIETTQGRDGKTITNFDESGNK